MQGLASTRIPSALYTERTYLATRSFIVYALTRTIASTSTTSAQGLEGFEDVLRWVYQQADGPKLLDLTIKAGQAIVARSESGGDRERADGLKLISKGACLPLRRVLLRLIELDGSDQEQASN